MKRSFVLVNLGLLAVAALLLYAVVGQWRQFEAEHRLERLKAEPRAAAGDSGRSFSPGTPLSFAAIVDHHLFNPDRSNDLPQEPAGQPLEAVKQPVPVLMGTVGIGGEDYALMVSGKSRSSGGLYSRLQVGQALDGYTLVQVGMDGVVMRFGATEVKVGLYDRARKPKRPAAAARPARTPRPRPAGVGSASRSGSRRKEAARRQPARSRRQPNSMKVPVGTVRDGKRLIEEQTPFGKIRTWVEDKPK